MNNLDRLWLTFSHLKSSYYYSCSSHPRDQDLCNSVYNLTKKTGKCFWGFKIRRESMESRKRSYRIWELFFFLFLLACWPRRLSALSVTVTDTECVYEFVLFDGDTVSGNFVVVDHDIFWGADHPGLDLTISSPAGNTVHSIHGSSGEKFEFKASRAGMYKFCFHNPKAIPETVSFYIHVGHIPHEHDLAKDEHLNPVNVKIAELREALESVTAEQKYLKARESQHRYTNESTRRRLIGYTITEYIALAAASFLQVVYIRRLFSKTVAYNRI